MNKIHAAGAPPAVSASSHTSTKEAHPTGKHPRQNLDPQMIEAAQGLEAIFLNEMNKAMRNTIEHSEFSLHNTATDIYQGMLDNEYAEIAARQNPVGLSDQILDYWARQAYNKK